MAKESIPAITLWDPVADKRADLNDEQGVRALLAGVIQRVAKDDAWKKKLPQDPTERIAAQILRKAGGFVETVVLMKDADSLHAILEGTDLAKDIAAVPKPKAGEKQIGLLGQDALERLCEDVIGALTLIWPTFRDSIERGEGFDPKKAAVAISFVPETDNAQAYIKVLAETRVSTREITRTSKVRRLKSGQHQLELFGS